MTRAAWTGAALSGAMLANSILPAAMPDRYNAYDKVSTAYETPHTKWAKPYAGGKLAVLVIVPGPGTREAVEFAQRFDVDLTVMQANLGSPFAYSEFGRKGRPWFLEVPPEHYVKPLLVKRLQPRYDLIVIGKIRWDAFPIEAQYRILEQVCDEGAGLLYVGPWGADDILTRAFAKRGPQDEQASILSGIPWQALPVLCDMPRDRLLHTTRFGKGRIATLRYSLEESEIRLVGGLCNSIAVKNHALTPAGSGGMHYEFEPFYVHTPAVYDYFQAILGRCALWAAGREPAVRLRVDGIPGRIGREYLDPKRPFRVTLQTTGEPFTATVTVRFRDFKGRLHKTVEEQVAVGETEAALAVPLPMLPVGRQVADIWVRDGEKTAAFAFAVLAVASRPCILAMDLDKPNYREGETLAGSAVIARPLRRATWFDAWVEDGKGRVLSSVKAAPAHKVMDNNRAGFSLLLRSPETPVVRVFARLRDELGVIHAMEKIVPCYPARDYDYPVVIGGLTDALNDYPNELLLQRAAEWGFEGIYNPVQYQAPWQIRSNIMAAGLRGIRLFPYITRLAGDQPLFEGWQRKLRAFEARVREVAPYRCSYTLGDDQHISYSQDLGYSPMALDRFRAYLKQAYGDLAGVNRIWRSSLTDWTEIDEAFVQGQKGKKNVAPWIDHRSFMDEMFTRRHEQMRTLAREYDPDARAGAGSLWESSGHGASLVGVDWERMLDRLDYHGCYSYHENMYKELRRCWLRPGSIASSIWGSYPAMRMTRNRAANQWAAWVSLLHDHKVFFLYNLNYGSEALIFHDLMPAPVLQWSLNEIELMKQGLATLVYDSPREDDPIAALFSQRNVHVCNALQSKAVRDHVQAVELATTLLQDCARQYKMTRLDWIEQGALGAKGYKLLVLPAVPALTDAQEAKIRAFVKAGGRILASAPFGTHDDHAWPRDGDFATRYGLSEEQVQYLDLETYKMRRQSAEGAAIRKQTHAFLQACGIPAAVRLDGDERWLHNVEVIRHRCGEGRIVSLLYDILAPTPNDGSLTCTMVLPQKAHVYAVQSGKYVGFTDRLENVVVSPGPATVFAVLPAKVTDVTVTFAQPTWGPGTDRQATVRVGWDGAPGAHTAVHVRVLEPGGKERREYRTNVLVKAGEGRFVLSLAENDRRGQWTLVARDALSGKETRVPFHLR